MLDNPNDIVIYGAATIFLVYMRALEIQIRKQPPSKALVAFFEAMKPIFKDLAVKGHVETESQKFSFSPNGEQVAFNDVPSSEPYGAAVQSLQHNEHLQLSSILIESPVRYSKAHAGSLPNLTITFSSKRTHSYDTVAIGLTETTSPSEAMKAEIGAVKSLAIAQVHAVFSVVDQVGSRSSPEALSSEVIAAHESHVTELKSLLHKLLTQTTERVHGWDAMLQEIAEKSDASLKSRLARLDEEFATKAAQLAQREEEFARQRAEFDDRANTLVRRDMLKKLELLTEKQREFKLSRETEHKRAPINFLLGVSLIVSALGFAGFTGFAIWRALESPSESAWFLLAPAAFCSALFTTMLIYFLRWNSQWYRQHAEAELFNAKHTYDIFRANWLVEMIFEFKEAKDFDLPPQLYEALSRNLFEGNVHAETPRHPIEDVLRMAGGFRSLSLTKGGFSVRRDDGPKA